MAIFNKNTQAYQAQSNTLHEVVMLAYANGQLIEGISGPLQAYNDSGSLRNLAATGEGHLEVAIHGPRLPFGSIHTESIRPEFQCDPIYGISNTEETVTIGHLAGGVSSANVEVSNGVFVCSTGTTALSFSALQSRARLRYRAGQGIVGRFTALFPDSISQSITVAGFGTGESGVYFGQNNGSFGILHSTGGVRQILNLAVTTGSSNTNDITITLANTPYIVTGVTDNTNTFLTAYQIATGNAYAGWEAAQQGSNVVFLSDSVGVKNANNVLGQTATAPAVGSFTTTRPGAAANDTWIAQTSWNGDKLDGTGPSGVELDVTKGNVYQIGIQYLGFGAITFQIEAALGNNNPEWISVHTLSIPNSRTTPSLSNPSFPFTAAAYSAGTSSNVSVSVGSFAGFIEGQKILTGPRYAFQGVGTSTTSSLTPLFTIRNDIVFGRPTSRANQVVLNLLSFSGATKSTSGLTTFYLIRNATLTAGTPNFEKYDSEGATSIDTGATICTTSNGNIITMAQVSESGAFDFPFKDEIHVQPGETVTLAVKSVTSSANCVGALNIREDH